MNEHGGIGDLSASVWHEEAPAPRPRSALDGDRDFDVAIVGAGFTGLSAARWLIARSPDLRVVVLEARCVGYGASGRNGGLMLNFLPHIEAPAGTLAHHYRLTRGVIDDLVAQNATRPGVASQRGTLEVITDAGAATEARNQVAGLQAAGVPVEYVTGATLAQRLDSAGAVAGIWDPNGGRINGLAHLRGLADDLEDRGVTLYEDTRVMEIGEGDEVVVRCRQGAVRAGAVVLGTGGYTPTLGYFRGGIIPLHSLVVSTASVGDPSEVGWGDLDGFSDDRPRLAYASRTGGGRLLFGGGSNGAYWYPYGGKPDALATPGSARFHEVERQLRAILPGAAGLSVDHQWSGPLALTLSRVPSIGVRGRARNVFYGVGYSGCGIALANLAGRVIADLFHGDHEPWRELPFYQRRLEWVPPEPARWLGYQFFTRCTGRTPLRTYRPKPMKELQEPPTGH